MARRTLDWGRLNKEFIGDEGELLGSNDADQSDGKGTHGMTWPFAGLCCKPDPAIWYGDSVSQKRPALFRGRHFEDVVTVLCVRWYLRYSLSYRDLEEMMAERGLSIDHVTIWRWIQRYALC